MPGRRQPAAALAENLQARTAQRGVRLLRDQLSAFAYGFALPKWSTVQRFVIGVTGARRIYYCGN